MGEMIWCTLNVHVPASWDTRWFASITDWADYTSDEESSVGRVLCAEGEMNWGYGGDTATAVLSYLWRQEIPYRFTDDGKYDLEGALVIHDPADPDETTRYETFRFEDALGAVLSRYEVMQIVNAGAFHNLERWLERTGRMAGDLSIDHLQLRPAPPLFEEEEL